MTKGSLRARILGNLASLDAEKLQTLRSSLTTQLVKFFDRHPDLRARTGAGFLPMSGEAAPDFSRLGVSLAYPVRGAQGMSFGLPDGGATGSIWLSPPYQVVEPEWVLVPGVAFTLGGARLGRGKGYYDRYLEGRTCVKVGLCWTGQVLESLPVEKHDSHMDYIITEDFCWDVTTQKKF